MKFTLPKIFALWLVVLLLPPARADELTISAAASLKDAMKRIGSAFEKAHPATKLTFNFGSSGTLQKQIENGAPVDVFIAASSKNTSLLRNLKLVEKPLVLARGELVLIAPKNSTITQMSQLSSPQVKRIAIGGPGVPAGDYARQSLAFYGAKTDGKHVLCKDVRAVLTQVEAGNVDAGFVYRTDAMGSKRIRIVTVLDNRSHKEIIYPIAVVAASRNRGGARSFAAFCRSKPAKKIWKTLGFRVGK